MYIYIQRVRGLQRRLRHPPHQLPIGIKVTPTSLVLSDMRRTREASALILRNSIQAKLMLISARAIGGV